MSRTRKAVLGSAFAYANFALALVSGFVLFPIIVWQLGAYDNGLWIITGELVGYLLLGDLGVFTVVVGATLLLLTAIAHQSLRSQRRRDADQQASH